MSREQIQVSSLWVIAAMLPPFYALTHHHNAPGWVLPLRIWGYTLKFVSW
jgi:hypothetical protein